MLTVFRVTLVYGIVLFPVLFRYIHSVHNHMMEPEIEILHPRRSSSAPTNPTAVPINAEHVHNTIPNKNANFSKKIRFWHQFWALLLKDFTLQRKQYVTNICQLMVPIVFISFAGLIQVIVNSSLLSNGVPVPGSESLPIPLDVGAVINCQKSGADNMPTKCHDQPFNFLLVNSQQQLSQLAASKDPPPNNNIMKLLKELMAIYNEVDQHATIDTQNILFDLPYYYIGKDPKVPLSIGEDINGNFESLLLPTSSLFNFSLNFTINPNYKSRYFKEHVHDDGNNIQIPFFVNLPNGNTTADLQRHLVEIVKYYEEIADTTNFANNEYNKIYDVTPQSQKQYNTTLENVQNEEFDRVKPQGGIYINSFDDGRTSDSIHFNYTVIANELSIYSVRGLPSVNLSGFNQSGAPSQGKFPLTGSYDVQRRNTLMNMVHNGILKYLLQQNGSSFGDASQSIIKTFITPFFPHKTNMTVDITNLLGGVLYPFAASFLFPVFIAALAKDKFERHLIMMEQNGLNKMTYWIITYIFNYAIYLIIAIIITIVSILWQVRLFTQTSAAILVIVFMIWGHSQVVLGFFFANFFNNPRIATVTGYIFVIAGVLVSEMLQLVKIFPDDQTPFAIYMLYPPFAFYRILFYLIHACADFRCYGIDELSSANGLNLLNTAILYLTGSTILLLLVGIYLSYVLPSEYGVRKSPFFPIIAVYKLMKRLLCKMGMSKICNKREMLNPATGSKLHSIDNDSNGIDEDVLQEENMIESEFNFIDAPIVIFQLRKEYPSTGGKPANVAVESFSLAINRNECFGLLGPNGAGKTTLISVLTGLYEPSHGFAKVAGYDLVMQMSDIHHHLGVCPQFDIQYPDLTAEEHLLFYARLKGAKFCRAGRIVEKALKQVNLYDARKKKSKELSGGMRRRLSVAMACIGSPDILILDEPTTGLDPASRRQVWEVIERVKIGKSVILTTHAMEEADHLCTRIGIMNFGRLRCLGSQNRLKAKFGTGYQLKFHCTPGRISDVERFVQVNLTAAKHVETFADMCTYQIEKEDVVVSQLFEMFDNAKDQVGIVDWGIKMTTLEDVFMTIVKSTSDNRTKLNNGWFGWLPCHNCYGKSS